MKVVKRPSIVRQIKRTLDGYHEFIIVAGEKHTGKSTLALRMTYDVYSNRSKKDAWSQTLHHCSFTPQQFYHIYMEAKEKVDASLEKLGVDPHILELDVNKDFHRIIDIILAVSDNQAMKIPEAIEEFRVPCIIIDDIAAHMHRGDSSIYYDKFFQQVFADMTLIRPYVGVIIGTTPDIGEIPRPMLKHVTGIISCSSLGKGQYRQRKTWVRFKGSIDGYSKLYDGREVTWEKLNPENYGKYALLRHLMSRHVSRKAVEALEEQGEEPEAPEDSADEDGDPFTVLTEDPGLETAF